MKQHNIDTRTSGIQLNYQLFAEPGESSQNPDDGHSVLTTSQRIAAILNGAPDNSQTQPQQQQQAPQQATDGQQVQQQAQENGTQSQQPAQQTEPVETPDTSSTNDGTGEQNTGNEPSVVPIDRYKNVQAWATKVSQENSDLKQQIERLTQQQSNNQSQQPQQQQPQQASIDPQTFVDSLYENPQQVLSEVVKSVIGQELSPIINFTKSQMLVDNWGNALKNFVENTPDYAENEQAMVDYINNNNLGNSDNPDGVLKDAYIHARRQNYKPPQQVDPTSYLQDEKFVTDNIINNPDIVNRIIRAQTEKLQQGQPPVSIASNGSQPIATPVERPTTMDGYRKMARSILDGNFGK
jgi:hypothetical protein